MEENERLYEQVGNYTKFKLIEIVKKKRKGACVWAVTILEEAQKRKNEQNGELSGVRSNDRPR